MPIKNSACLSIALLIDADNASAKDIHTILNTLENYGEVLVKRLYGNFVGHNSQWKAAINEHALKPIQQFAFTSGKNATDSAMIIDAMDLMYTHRFDIFALVSSDSDFTALAIRLKEQGIKVFGFGKSTTPQAFLTSCSMFFHLDSAQSSKPNDIDQTSITPEQSPSISSSESKIITPLTLKIKPISAKLVKQIFELHQQEWLPMSIFGSALKRLQPDFDPKKYNGTKLTDIVKHQPHLLDYQLRILKDGNHHLHVKLKTTD